MECTLVFPHQLYPSHPAIATSRLVLLTEDPLYFSQYRFHKNKLVLHRASMKFYESWLQERGFQTNYVEAHQADLEPLLRRLAQQNVKVIYVADPVDYLLERRLTRFAEKYNINLRVEPSPNFLTSGQQLDQMMQGERKYLMASFYIRQRKRLNVLMDNGQPIGGKWSFDAENRKQLPKGLPLPPVVKLPLNPFVVEAKQYVNKHFPDNPGSIENFHYPVTFAEADMWLQDFLVHRMRQFGDYEDAIVNREQILFHSVLTPALNIGLLQPDVVLERTMDLHQSLRFPLNSLEGFIRQIIGWREFMRLMYVREGVPQRTTNHFGFSRKIPQSFYTGTTGIMPVDDTIKKVLETGYCHHIERLMVLGNFMLLCEFDPDEVYRWFMELFIDAYDWVMVPNVYGMSQYAEGGKMTTKPYVSGSNYVLKMSDYKRGPWCETWDALYWRFIYKHRGDFARNPRMSMVVNLVNKMDNKKLTAHLQVAEAFLRAL